ncbi:MAG: hypothetical protein ABDH20_12035 [Thermus sp.]
MIRIHVWARTPRGKTLRRQRAFGSWLEASAWLWALKRGRWARLYESAPTGGSHFLEGRTPRGGRLEVLAREEA